MFDGASAEARVPCRALADPKQGSSKVKVIAGDRYITQKTGTDSWVDDLDNAHGRQGGIFFQV